MTESAPTSTVRRMRELQGISLRELERRTGINRGALSRIERGWVATEDESRKILAALTQPADIPALIGSDAPEEAAS